MCVAEAGNFQTDAFDLVPENDADGKQRLPVEQVYRVDRSFYCGNLAPATPQAINVGGDVPRMLPWHPFLRAQGCFTNSGLRWTGGDSTEVQLFYTSRLGGTKK
jgi:hypothetical protein